MTESELRLRDNVKIFVEQLTHPDGFWNVRKALDERMCCNGYMCGCRGSTVGEYLAYELGLVLE